jgi:hypothetical protein
MKMYIAWTKMDQVMYRMTKYIVRGPNNNTPETTIFNMKHGMGRVSSTIIIGQDIAKRRRATFGATAGTVDFRTVGHQVKS